MIKSYEKGGDWGLNVFLFVHSSAKGKSRIAAVKIDSDIQKFFFTSINVNGLVSKPPYHVQGI